MRPKFDVDSIDSFWDMEEQSMWRKERKTQKSHYLAQCLSSKLQYIHPIFKCSDLATHFTQSTRSTQWAQTSLADADHYSHMPTVKILRLGGERLPPTPHPPPPKKSFGSLPSPQSGYATPIMVFFAHLFWAFTHRRRSPGHSNFVLHCIF